MCSEDRKDIGVCYAFCFLPLAMYIYGWFDEKIEYDKVEIYDGEDKVGEAEEGLEKYNILLHYGNTLNSGKGWKCYVSHFRNRDSVSNIRAIALKGGKKKAEINAEVKGESIEMAFCSLSKRLNTQKNILVIPGASNKISMLNKIANEMKHYNFIVLIESVPEDKVVSRQELIEEIYRQYNIGNIEENLYIYVMPMLFMRNKFLAKKTAVLGPEDNETLGKFEWLEGLSEVIREKFPNMEKSYSQYYVSKFYQFIDRIIDRLNIQGVMLWNQFFVLHDIVKHICEIKNLPIIYSESGVLPGTLAFETSGQMGESIPAIQYKKFRELSVSAEELSHAHRIISYLYESKLNRWGKYGVYRKEQLKDVYNRIVPGRPIIFYAGQNDYESGIKPYTENTQKYHSPIFRSSYEAALALGKICEKNKWNLIYKRHPMMRREKRNEILPNNIINFDELEIHDIIDFADVTITILSQTAYVALIRNKPVVMLGYNQLRGKECAYEAFCIEDVESQIKCALEFGRTQTQTDNFTLHVAQLLKYYLFDDIGVTTDISYGRNQEELINYVIRVLEGNALGI